jgi:aminopeptidase N
MPGLRGWKMWKAGRIYLLLIMVVLLMSCSDNSPDNSVRSAVPDEPAMLAPGVSQALALYRASSLSNVAYQLELDLPASAQEPVTGKVSIRFELHDASKPLVLDFRAPADHVSAVLLDGQAVPYELPQDHIVIPAAALQVGAREVRVEFRSTDAALNRQADFLYALFVPDRASTAFPVFDQPDIKAQYSLSLTVPQDWETLSNGAQLLREPVAGVRHRVTFEQTLPISSYLFAFAAGDLQIESAERNGRRFNMYHRETDPERLARSRDVIFDLHATALDWLEDYTGIDYPFGKFDFFAIPAFQFGGMEHPGAIWYRAESLFLDPSASRSQELGRASLIAHETAHMWFGDLVTMNWFNDVWMKEVFANFMAAKIAGPSFPDLNLSLRFYQAHHPTAYAVDRTAGANPIRQPLANMRDAGSLYGAIIYQKAPVVMQQLETLLGETLLQEGLRRYLQQFSFANASWSDLVQILDGLTQMDLARWSEVWVNEPGRPRIELSWNNGEIRLVQSDDMAGRNLLWSQRVSVLEANADGTLEHSVTLQGADAVITSNMDRPMFLLAGVDGVSYARFVLDDSSRDALLKEIHTLENPLHRAVAWQNLWEEVIEERLPPEDLLGALELAVAVESDELLAQQILGLMRNIFWSYHSPAQRQQRAPALEAAIWQAMQQASTPGRKGAYFSALVDVSLSAEGVHRLQQIWQGELVLQGLPILEQQFITLAEALAVREADGWQQILDEQQSRISNPDRLARFRFVRPALSAVVAEREALFYSFAELSNRRQESWVLDAQRLIHHPLRSQQSLHLLPASLALAHEIQQSGDIFFPLRWLNATLDGHNSPQAAMMVRDYLQNNPHIPDHLRAKVLQAGDRLLRL